MNVGVIIPAFQEAAAIQGVVRAIRAQGLAVVVVDDGSADATAAEAEKGGAIVLRHARNQGKGVALRTGFAYARQHGYAAVITLDGDGQHDPADLPALLAAYARGGADVLVGNRMTDVARMPRIRRWTNRFMSWLLSRMMGQTVPDTQCGYRLFRCDVLPELPLTAERYAAESEILLEAARRGLRIGAVPVKTIYGGERSKVHPVSDTVRFLAMVWRYQRKAKQDGTRPMVR
ncbi:MAG: glycosyltransferase family 2 protein [Kiritimatiellaeota bacterium]|nr:glycosyltransferase family 2 protein [Kiritimatiellota bacterium]